MSQASTPTAVDQGALEGDADAVDDDGALRTHEGVRAINAARSHDEPPQGWEYDPSTSRLAVRGRTVDLSGMTQREREVYRSVELHGMRPADLARMTDAEPSTIRTLLESAREATR